MPRCKPSMVCNNKKRIVKRLRSYPVLQGRWKRGVRLPPTPPPKKNDNKTGAERDNLLLLAPSDEFELNALS